jgi:hypothetical protein
VLIANARLAARTEGQMGSNLENCASVNQKWTRFIPLSLKNPEAQLEDHANQIMGPDLKSVRDLVTVTVVTLKSVDSSLARIIQSVVKNEKNDIKLNME